MTREPFPFTQHLDLKQVARVERLREQYASDIDILEYRERLNLGDIDGVRLLQFMRRNPRRNSVAA